MLCVFSLYTQWKALEHQLKWQPVQPLWRALRPFCQPEKRADLPSSCRSISGSFRFAHLGRCLDVSRLEILS
jgi:hypothetical protein